MTAPTVGSLTAQSRVVDGRETVQCLQADPTVHFSNDLLVEACRDVGNELITFDGTFDGTLQVGTLVHFHFSNRHVIYRLTGRAEYSDGVWEATWPD